MKNINRLADFFGQVVKTATSCNRSESSDDMADRHRGYVYFISDGERVKIGYSTDVAGRLCDLQQSTPVDLKLLGKFPGSMADERAMHARFASLCINREWFRLEPMLQEFIDGLKFIRGPVVAAVAKIDQSLEPQNISTDPAKFKAWADNACCKWPSPLQVAAAHAWHELTHMKNGEAFERFSSAYADWRALSA